MKISINEIKNKFLTFFYNKGHKIIKGSSLIPKNDRSNFIIYKFRHESI